MTINQGCRLLVFWYTYLIDFLNNMKKEIKNNSRQNLKFSLKNIFVALLGFIALVYIINPSAGIFELIPDIIPFVGNLDEAAAVFLLHSAMDYFGIGVKSLFKK